MPFLAAAAALAPVLGKLLGGGAKSAAGDRESQNNFTQTANQQALSQWGTQQNALLASLLAKDRGAMDRYATQQGATTNAVQGMQGAVSHALDAQSNENLQRAQLGLQAPSVRAKQSVMGSLMKNLQPVSIGGNPRINKPTITGGMSASALDPTTRQHGDALMQSALQAQLSGSDVPEKSNFLSGVQNWGSTVLQPPSETDFSKSILAPPKLQGYAQPGKMESILSGGSLVGNILGPILQELLKGKSGGGMDNPFEAAG